jgi:hypothetical protein
MSDWTTWRGLNVPVVLSARRAVTIHFLDRSGASRACEALRQLTHRLFDHHRTCDDARAVEFGFQCETNRRRIAS